MSPILTITCEGVSQCDSMGGYRVAALPAVVRFVPIARTPAANRVLMRIMLFVAGLLVPIGAIGTVFALYYLGSEIEFGRMWLSLLTAAFGLVALR